MRSLHTRSYHGQENSPQLNLDRVQRSFRANYFKETNSPNTATKMKLKDCFTPDFGYLITLQCLLSDSKSIKIYLFNNNEIKLEDDIPSLSFVP